MDTQDRDAQRRQDEFVRDVEQLTRDVEEMKRRVDDIPREIAKADEELKLKKNNQRKLIDDRVKAEVQQSGVKNKVEAEVKAEMEALKKTIPARMEREEARIRTEVAVAIEEEFRSEESSVKNTKAALTKERSELQRKLNTKLGEVEAKKFELEKLRRQVMRIAPR